MGPDGHVGIVGTTVPVLVMRAFPQVHGRVDGVAADGRDADRRRVDRGEQSRLVDGFDGGRRARRGRAAIDGGRAELKEKTQSGPTRFWGFGTALVVTIFLDGQPMSNVLQARTDVPGTVKTVFPLDPIYYVFCYSNTVP